jgi:hypothetical protein
MEWRDRVFVSKINDSRFSGSTEFAFLEVEPTPGRYGLGLYPASARLEFACRMGFVPTKDVRATLVVDLLLADAGPGEGAGMAHF